MAHLHHLLLLCLLACCVTIVASHSSLSERALSAHSLARRSFSSCQHSDDLRHRSLERRHAFAKRHLQRRGLEDGRLERRATATQKNIATGTATADPFKGAIPTCVLAPYSIQGPYYLSKGYLRDDLRESQPGIDLLLDVQIFNARTCELLPNVMLDFWHCNSTGVYSGYKAEKTEGETWFRGASQSDDAGIVQITTKFPGHYVGRAVHIHIMAHTNGTLNSDGSYHGGSIPHVGQLYFDQDLISSVSKVSPYSTNTGRLTENKDDMLFKSLNADDGYDGLVTIEKLGDNNEDGLLGYISLGINVTADHETGQAEYEVTPAGAETDTTTKESEKPSSNTASLIDAGYKAALWMGLPFVAMFLWW